MSDTAPPASDGQPEHNQPGQPGQPGPPGNVGGSLARLRTLLRLLRRPRTRRGLRERSEAQIAAPRSTASRADHPAGALPDRQHPQGARPQRRRRHGAARRHRRPRCRAAVCRDRQMHGRAGPFARAGLSRNARRRHRLRPCQGRAGAGRRPPCRASSSRLVRKVLFVAALDAGPRSAACRCACRASTSRWSSTSSAASTGWSRSRI